MMLNITEAAIQGHASPESFQRGVEYYRDGAVLSVTLRGSALYGEVEGSEPLPYVVRIEIAAGDIVNAACTCPYDWGGWCKHIVATFTASLDQPQAVEVLPPLDMLLGEMDQEQLKDLLLRLAELMPGLIEMIESEFARPPDR